MKKAVIVGHTGQDGTYLSALLREKKYEVTGVSRKQVSENKYEIKSIDILQELAVENFLKKIQPDEIYFLAAVHQSSEDAQLATGDLFRKSLDLNLLALINFLEGIRKYSPHCKLFYAGSSHVFGNPEKSPQDESSPFRPDCIYGITKTAGINACHFYRERYAVFAGVGIFYNHESPLRSSNYVSSKIVQAAVAIKKGLTSELILGNLESKIDWGYAPDYMYAAYSILQLSSADDFIISSGALHSIADFVGEVFAYLELDWTNFVKVNPLLISKRQKQNLFGNNQKIRNTTGWTPGVDFKGLIKILVNEELKKYGSE